MRAFSASALEAAFGRAAPEHFAWQTACPYVADEERALVRAAFLPLGRRVLDLGCGEGATLVHLGAPAGAVGVDLFAEKLAFARERLPACRFVEASAEALPFEDGAFDHVLVRDVIHHLETPERAVRECRRVLAPGGRIDVLEPCRYNPLVLAHALATPAERGELRSTLPFLSRLLVRSGFRVTATARHQPLAVHRVVFHPELGSPSLASSAAARGAVRALERLAGVAMPRALWTYLHVRATP